LITSQKNQPLLFAQGGCLEENLKANKRGTLKKYSSKYLFHIYHKFDYKLEKSTLIICTRWLPWRENRYEYKRGTL